MICVRFRKPCWLALTLIAKFSGFPRNLVDKAICETFPPNFSYHSLSTEYGESTLCVNFTRCIQ